MIMFKDNIIEELNHRDLIDQLTNKNKFVKKILKDKIKLYCGFDPTADSLHIGHLLPLLVLRRFQNKGHTPFVLIGGATGLIGDPSFRCVNRKLNNYDIIYKWIENIKKQIFLFLDSDCMINRVKIVNNYTWFSKIDILSFLYKIGKHFSVNEMLHKKAIKKRFTKNTTGISYSEFSYNLLQSYDFFVLNKKYNIELQVGGSDQWGNIISGINLINKLHKKEVFGLTLPLVTNSSGVKISKTEKNIIWLDPKKTTPYEFYQFWINISDSDVYYFLKIFTFMSIEEIDYLKKQDYKISKIPKAKYILAEKMTRLVHGEKVFFNVKKITESLFSNNTDILNYSDFDQIKNNGILKIYLEIGKNIKEALIKAKIALSNSQAKEMIKSSSIYINNKKCLNINYIFLNHDRILNKYSIIRYGKKKYFLIIWKK